VYEIALFLEAPDILYTLWGGISSRSSFYKSFDGGLTWTPVNRPGGIYCIEVNPYNPDILYAGTIHYYPLPLDTLMYGIDRSLDGGLTWTFYPLSASVADIEFDLTNPDIIYAGGGKIFKSTDGGESWFEIADYSVKSLRVDPDNPSHIVAGTYGNGLYESFDAGSTWIHLESSGNIGKYVRDIEIS